MSKRTASAVKKSLRKKLIRMAANNPEGSDQRKAALKALAKMGYDLQASVGKTAVKPETEDFVRWVMSTQAPLSPGEVETFVNRTLGIKTNPPVKRRSGPRYQRGDQVQIVFAKHKDRNSDAGPYKRFNGKIGTVTEINESDKSCMVAFKGEPAPVRFEGALKTRGVGIYKYTPPYTITGSAKIEMIYDAGGKSTPDAKVVVDAYMGRAKGTEKRAANYYTGHVVFAAMGGKGFYFRGFPQQRMDVDPQSEAGFKPRTFNPSLGKVLYIGVFNSRPSKWKSELANMDQAAEANDAAG